MNKNIKTIKLYNRKIFKSKTGSVMKIIDTEDKNYLGFGETYFSTVKYNSIKGWKYHKS